MHRLADRQETLSRVLATVFDGFGLASSRQVAPFQISASVTPGAPPCAPPTAMQDRAVGQDTPDRALPDGITRPAAGWIRHAEPFQRSASAPDPERPAKSPTAVQALGAEQDTAVSRLTRAPGMFWLLRRMRHLAPFQASARVPTPDRAWWYPTAIQARGERQDTELSVLPRSRLVRGARVASRCHLSPVHASASGAGLPEPRKWLPTAMQNVWVGQLTEVNKA